MELRINDMEAAIDSTVICKGINMKIMDKEFVGIIGPNGSGKSTLLKCIYRVLKPSGGTIFLDGKQLDTMNIRESAKEMAVVSQHHFHSFDFTVKEIVLMGRSPHKKFMERDHSEDYKILYDCLDKVGMKESGDRSFSSLSGGEQQRVILARALAQQAKCLVLDEPTNHLDITYQLQIMDIVKGLKLTVLSAIHDLNIAAMYCDKIFVMKNGKIAGFGTPEEVFTEKMINDIYNVKAKILTDHDTGQLHIMYRPLDLSGR